MKRFKISLCLLTKDENKYLEEWLSWHTDIGVEHFYIYDNGSKIPVLSSISPDDRDRCTIVDFSGPHAHTQIDAYEDCLKRFGAETEWMGFIDTDEFIRVLDGTDIRLFLREFSYADVIVVWWLVYNADGQIHKADRPVRERFQHIAEYPPHLPQCKCIVRPKKIKHMGAHFPIGATEGLAIVNGDHQHVKWMTGSATTRDRIVIDHYFTRSYEEWKEKMTRGSCDPICVRGSEWFDLMNPGFDYGEDGQ